MTNDEFYRSLYQLNLEGEDPFVAITACTQQLAYLYKSAFDSFNKAFVTSYSNDSIKHIADFSTCVSRCREILYDTQVIKAS